MPLYENSTHKSTARTEFAEAALGVAFRGRDLSLAREPDFVDRQPHQRPRRLGNIAAEAVGDVGQAALGHWLRQAARTRGQEREVALQIAREIAEMLGIPWGEVISEAA
jgi:hypothetical protein